MYDNNKLSDIYVITKIGIYSFYCSKRIMRYIAIERGMYNKELKDAFNQDSCHYIIS